MEEKKCIYNIKDLLILEENNLCCDCMNNSSTWTHTLFGIFLCSECILNHKSVFLDTHDRIKSLEVNSLTSDDILILRLGGNGKFNKFLETYDITTKNTNIKSKYLFKATIYYIKLLHSLSTKSNLDEIKPSLMEGLTPISPKDIEKGKRLYQRVIDKLQDITGYKTNEEIKAETMMNIESNKIHSKIL